MNRSRWNVLPSAPDEYLLRCSTQAGTSPLIAQLLYNRGLNDPSQVELFLNCDERLCADPFLLSGMGEAVPRIYRALLSGERIAVYGDFDVDGVTSTALMVQGLSELGGAVIPYIPHRVSEGHGLRKQALDELADEGVTLIITVDCGITDVDEVKHAARLNIDIIITDHHVPPADLPPAFAIVDPKLPGSSYPFKELAGVGVACKVMEGVLQSLGKRDRLDSQMDLVALGTVADMVPLLGENRYLVKKGLRALNLSPRLGIKEILARAGLTQGVLTADSITWVLSPWLNASGRLEHAIASYRLLTTDSVQEARELAAMLGQQNVERQKLTSKAMMDAHAQIGSHGLSELIMLCNTDFPLGISGPVAGKLVDEYYRPVIIVSIDDKTASGSCRSIPEFNIMDALSQCSGLLGRFGGHAQAAGFSTPTRNLDVLQRTLTEIVASQLEGLDLRPRLDIDLEMALPELGGETYRHIQKLAPFGKGNSEPVFISRGVDVSSCRTMGAEQQHLRMRLRQHGTSWEAVAFRQGDALGDVSQTLDIVYYLELDRWGGQENLRLNIQSFAPSS